MHSDTFNRLLYTEVLFVFSVLTYNLNMHYSRGHACYFLMLLDSRKREFLTDDVCNIIPLKDYFVCFKNFILLKSFLKDETQVFVICITNCELYNHTAVKLKVRVGSNKHIESWEGQV